MKALRVFILFVILLGMVLMLTRLGLEPSQEERLRKVERWFSLSDYSASESPSPILWDHYDMAILDPGSHPPFEGIHGDCILIAYVSLGQAENYRAYWPKVEKEPWIIKKDPHWSGSYWVDVRNPRWRALILYEVIPQIIAQGFDGLFMDTLDTASDLEEISPTEYFGSAKAMAEFVKEIHETYPKLLLISNNAYEILPQIAPYLNGFLVEGINSILDLNKGGITFVDPERRENRIQILHKLMREYKLPVFTLDYVGQNDRASAERCFIESRKLGFKPYVSEADRDRIYFQ